MTTNFHFKRSNPENGTAFLSILSTNQNVLFYLVTLQKFLELFGKFLTAILAFLSLSFFYILYWTLHVLFTTFYLPEFTRKR